MSSEAIDRVSRTEDAMDGQQRIAYGVQLHSRDHPLINRGEPRQTARVTHTVKDDGEECPHDHPDNHVHHHLRGDPRHDQHQEYVAANNGEKGKRQRPYRPSLASQSRERPRERSIRVWLFGGRGE